MRNVVALVLGGGRGTRLFPLTQIRSKPAVPLAGKYRLIDIPLSNCINSGINRMYVLTQFHSVSLHRHIRQTYKFDPFSQGFVEILAAQQTMKDSNWYQGTADAVRKNLRYIQQSDVDYVLILSGDQLYRMDFSDMIKKHKAANADVSIAALPVDKKDAHALGIMRGDDSGRVTAFTEKPQTEEALNAVLTPSEWIDEHGIESNGRECLASMGIYLFNKDLLVDILSNTDSDDFGKEVFPTTIESKRVQMFLFDGYWEDIGTIRSFFEANLDLAKLDAPFDLTSELAPIYSRARFLPPTRIENANIKQSLIADGCVIDEGAVIENSVIGLRCRIGKGVTIKNSVIMGSDFYETPDQLKQDASEGVPVVGIEDGAQIESAIIDKNCHIGKNAVINPKDAVEHDDPNGIYFIRDGIVVVPKDGIVPDDFKMEV